MLRALHRGRHTNPVHSRGVRQIHSATLYDSLTQANKPIFQTLADKSREPLHNKSTLGKSTISWYSCGPTVYDSAHLGHARTYVTLDAIRRALEGMLASQHGDFTTLFYAMGITDIDDKIINRSVEKGLLPAQLARFYEAEFMEDMASLNVKPPTAILRVSEHIEEIQAYISRLLENGLAYISDVDKSVYMSVPSLGQHYGKLAPSYVREKVDNATAREILDSETAGSFVPGVKRDPRDFALWKTQSPAGNNSPGGTGTSTTGPGWDWDSPWGRGRPGWHIECSAMTRSLFGGGLDIHSGGVDLMFPHHCNEIAQADGWMGTEACDHGYEWVRIWLHTGHLHIQGAKMSKSMKNFITVRDMLRLGYDLDDTALVRSSPSEAEGTPQIALSSSEVRGGSEKKQASDASDNGSPGGERFLVPVSDAFRLFCLSHHYRSTLSFSKDRLHESARVGTRIHGFLHDVTGILLARKHKQATVSSLGSPPHSTPPLFHEKWDLPEYQLFQDIELMERRIQLALNSDFNFPAALRAIQDGTAAGREYLRVRGGHADARFHALLWCAERISAPLANWGLGFAAGHLHSLQVLVNSSSSAGAEGIPVPSLVAPSIAAPSTGGSSGQEYAIAQAAVEYRENVRTSVRGSMGALKRLQKQVRELEQRTGASKEQKSGQKSGESVGNEKKGDLSEILQAISSELSAIQESNQKVMEESDRLRDEGLPMTGWTIKDTSSGPLLTRKLG